MAIRNIPQDKAIVVRGNGYDYLFSRGIVANHIKVRGINYEIAYSIAREVENYLLENEIVEINEKSLFDLVRKHSLEYLDKEQAERYDIIERWNLSGEPLVILICGAPGSFTTVIAQKLAEQFSISQIISTNTVRSILQRVIAPEIAPELHTECHLAYEHLRPIQSMHEDNVILGYEEHTKYVTETIESMINRSLSENLTVLFRGVHLDPKFISKNILDRQNVLFFCIKVVEPRNQLDRLLEINGKGKEDEVTLDFPDIRKIHDYLVSETEHLSLPVIELKDDLNETINKIIEVIIDRLKKAYQLKSSNQKEDNNNN